jgi:hypothetical protein
VRRFFPRSWFGRSSERRVRDPMVDRFTAANCPVCRAPLVVRVDCRGPYFFCRCVRRRPPENPAA